MKIYASKKNEVYLIISCEKSIALELHFYFSFKIPNCYYMEKYKNNSWDGTIRLFNLKTHELYVGLLSKLIEFCTINGYEIVLDESLKSNTSSVSKLYIDNILKQYDFGDEKNKLDIRDYQIDAIHSAYSRNRCIILCPTSSGKSLIIYILIRMWQAKYPNEKILLTITQTNLVKQMYNDFKHYSSSDNSWNVEDNCHMIYSKQSKKSNKQVIISTWQSIYNLPKPWFSKFGTFIGDESHQYKAKCLTQIATKLTNASRRVGTTGTLDDIQINKLVLEGIFGEVVKITSSKELMDSGYISTLNIKNIILTYPDHIKKKLARKEYHEEINFIISSPERNEIIKNLAMVQKRNTLILFDRVEKHGKILYDILTKNNKKEVYFIHGKTDVEDRERIRNLLEKNNNCILLASVGVFSVGANIKNLQSLIFTHPYKSKIRNLQSIGRILRLDSKSNKATLYDLVDDLRWKKWENFSFKHWLKRIETYNKEKFKYSSYSIKMNIENKHSNIT